MPSTPLVVAALVYVIQRVQKCLELPNFVPNSVKFLWGRTPRPPPPPFNTILIQIEHNLTVKKSALEYKPPPIHNTLSCFSLFLKKVCAPPPHFSAPPSADCQWRIQRNRRNKDCLGKPLGHLFILTEEFICKWKSFPVTPPFLPCLVAQLPGYSIF